MVQERIEGFHLSPQQRRLWKLQPEGGHGPYRTRCAVRLDGELDEARLRAAVARAVARHEILRTGFRLLPGMKAPLQIIGRGGAGLPAPEDLSGLDPAGQERRLDALFADAGPDGGGADAGPLSARLLRLGPDSHVLLLSLPALCGDAATMRNLVEEVRRGYAGGDGEDGAGGEDGEGGEPLQYADLAEWQNDLLTAEDTEAGREFWRGRARELRAEFRLPFERRGATEASPDPASESLHLSADEARSLDQAAAGRLGTTAALFLLSCWKVLLWRLTGEGEVVVGVAHDGRGDEALRDALGPLTKYLPASSRLDARTPFGDLVKQVEAGFGELVQWHECFNWGHDGDGEGALPGFEYEELPEPMRGGGLTFTVVRQQSRADRHSLKLSCLRRADGLTLEFHYDRRLFAGEDVRRLRSEYAALLRSAAARPEEQVGKLDSLGEDERRRLLLDLNATAAEYPREKLVGELFEEQAARTPDVTAVAFDGGRVTYRELNERADEMARRLRSLGVGPESRVGVMAGRSAELFVGLLGVVKAGGAYVPLDPTYPRERLAFMIEDSGVRVLLAQESLRDSLPPHSARVVSLDGEPGPDEGGEAPGEEAPPPAASPDNLVYVIYTSGTTGNPKGTLVSHRNLMSSTAARLSFYGEPVGNFLLLSSFAFDSSVAGIFWTLCSGGTLTLPPEDFQRDPAGLAERAGSDGVTHMLGLPSFYSLLLSTSGGAAGPLGGLRAVIVAGEPCPPELVEAHRRALPGTRLFNEYGPTEATVWSTVHDCLAPAERPTVPIGRPIANTQVYVLDAGLGPVPTWAAGEVYVGGEGVVRGYLGRPGLTAERFVPHPFSAEPGARLYRTGDLARVLPGGELEFLGRADHQVKIRGYRIEIAEVEAALARHPAVRECVVVAREDAPGEKRLAAYIVADADRALTSEELREFLGASLPEYMIPSAFVALDALPLGPNGKVDRRALPAPERSRLRTAREYVAPRDGAEAALAEVWARVLGVEKVGVHDNFFALGGDSIRSVQVRALALESGLRFSVQQLFEHQTVEALARALGADGADAPAVEEAQTRPAAYEPFSLVSAEDRARLPEGLEDAYPLAKLQLGMLFHSEYDSTSAAYHDLTSFHLRMPLDVQRFEHALGRLFERHPVLRTSFDLKSYSEPLQLVHRAARPPLEVVDLSGLDPAEQERRLDEWIGAEKMRRFDWSEPPLLRFHVHLRGPEDLQLTLTLHHAVLDGWSAATMFTELFKLYFSLSGEAEPPEPSPAVRYAEFIALERAALESEESRAYWVRHLEDFAASTIPRLGAADAPAPEKRHRVVNVPVTPEVSEGLKAVAEAARVPLKSVLLAAHLRVLGLLTGQEAVTTGLVSHGRPEEGDAARVLGLFLNTLPFCFRLGDGSWADLARRAFEAERGMMPHRWFPLAEAQRLAGNTRLFEAAFNFMHFHVYESLRGTGQVEVAGVKVAEETDIPLMAHFRVNLGTSDVGLELDFDAGVFTEEQAEAVAGYYLRALSAVAAEPAERHRVRSLLTEEERRQVLYGWNQTLRPYPQDHTLHELIGRRAARHPQRTAVVFEGHSLTYGELDARANQVARGLRRLGVGPDVPVAVFMQRSLEMVVALVGILKAGGGYMPLDTESPTDRLRLMLDEARPPVLLTQRRLSGKVPRGGEQVVYLDSDWQTFADEEGTDPGAAVTPDNLAYVIYTSGSTGRPKGVMNSHRGICNRLLWMQEEYGLTAEDRVIQKTPYSFDVSVWEFFWPLLTGARLVVSRPDGHRDSAYLADLIEREGVTTLHFVPPMLQVFLEEPRLKRETSIRRVICSGEALPYALQELFFARLDAELHNLYGPTEAAVDVTYWRCAPNADERVPIGRPVANTQIYILDASLRPVPIGTPGELYIGGVQLARGYLARPDLTADRFVPDPYGQAPGGRLYRTGDLARQLPGGEVEYLGRIDHQVKIRGHRIELGEVEAALRRQEGVGEAVVVASAGEGGEKRLVAYVVGEAGAEALSWAGLRAKLAEELPPYMVPSAGMVLEKMPLTPNGKVDRKALPAPERRQSDADFVAPRDDLERELTAVWEEMLKISPLGVRANFFELGGHSLTALRLIAKVQALAGRTLPLSTVFEQPTVEQMARFLRRGEDSSVYSPVVALQPNGSKCPFFFVHTAGGNVLRYIPLARAIGKERPFYAFQSQDVEREQKQIPVEEMATIYIEAMLEIQPEGPYMLGGWSMGGVVAFEMARQLRARGREVALLVLVDAKVWREGHGDKLAEAVMLVSFALESGLSPEGLDLKDAVGTEFLRRLMDKAKREGMIQTDLELEQMERFFEIYKNNVQAGRDYVPQRMAVRAVLFKARDHDAELNREVTDDWSDVIPGIATYEIPGDHFTMMEEPNVRILTSLLNSNVEAAGVD